MQGTNEHVSEHVARALDELQYLRIDPIRLEAQSQYPPIVGGFGTVSVAKLGDQLVAVKEIRITGDVSDRARFASRFARELTVWAPLEHPNLLKLLAFHLSTDMCSAQFICPFYERGHVGQYLSAYNPDHCIRVRLAVDTALGLQYLHEHKIIHGDLKDANVLVDLHIRALLCDYGLARMIDDDGRPSGMTTSKLPMSTRFASPELVSGEPRSFHSDIWAWGCLILQILADIIPYADATNDLSCVLKIASGSPPADISDLDVLGHLRPMLKSCWDRDPLHRPGITECISHLLPSLPGHNDLDTIQISKNDVSNNSIESGLPTMGSTSRPRSPYPPALYGGALGSVPYTAPPRNEAPYIAREGSSIYRSISPAIPAQTQRIFIPNDLVASVIGKGATKINEIQAISGSKIRVMGPAATAPGAGETSANDRLVTVTGQPNQVQVAMQLINTRLDLEIQKQTRQTDT